jgi:hypothetical protein
LSTVLDGDEEEIAAAVADLARVGREKEEERRAAAQVAENSSTAKGGSDAIVYCADCEDGIASRMCVECGDPYCNVCWAALHRRGNRAAHTFEQLAGPAGGGEGSDDEEEAGYRAGVSSALSNIMSSKRTQSSKKKKQGSSSVPFDSTQFAIGTIEGAIGSATADDDVLQAEPLRDRARFIPLRLSFEERKYMRLLESALRATDYTTKVDTQRLLNNESRRLAVQLKEISAFLSGLVFVRNYSEGAALLEDKDFVKHRVFFQTVFEVSRRYKVLNPEKMRSEYGKLMYLLQDAQLPAVRDAIGFDLRVPVKTVYRMLEEKGALSLLDDPAIEVATRAISYDPKVKDRRMYDEEVRQKNAAVKMLCRKYGGKEVQSNSYMYGMSSHKTQVAKGVGSLTPDDVELCLVSIGDNRSFLLDNHEPVRRTMQYLHEFFDPVHESGDPLHCLAIDAGQDGARLTHSHRRQYAYVLQSLWLWKEVQRHMFRLWFLSDDDLLGERAIPYTMTDTGQGLHRVQDAPLVARSMRSILHRMQTAIGEDWVGSSVVHLGDVNVPNALMFIDKYTKVASILGPVCTVLRRIEELYESSSVVRGWIDETYGSVDDARRLILSDLFRSGFDGSGALNYIEAGSCTDGRLTSIWNWCAALDSKPFAPLFRLCGFKSFDGTWG